MTIIAGYGASSPTFDTLITEVVTNAQGYAVAPDQVYSLSDAMTASALTMKIDGARAPGVYEIDNELIRVIAVDTASGNCTIHPSGRGWLGSVAAAHSAGAVVVEDPLLPRVRVAGQVNEIVGGLYPRLFGVATLETEMGPTSTVELPADAEGVLDVRYLDPISTEYQRVRTWEAENRAGDTTTGKAVIIPRLREGDTVRVVYSIRPPRLTEADDLWSDTGLPDSIKDIVQNLVLARLVRHIDVARFSNRAVTPKDPSQSQVSIGMQLSRSLQQDAEAQLAREAQELRSRFPARQHFTR